MGGPAGHAFCVRRRAAGGAGSEGCGPAYHRGGFCGSARYRECHKRPNRAGHVGGFAGRRDRRARRRPSAVESYGAEHSSRGARCVFLASGRQQARDRIRQHAAAETHSMNQATHDVAGSADEIELDIREHGLTVKDLVRGTWNFRWSSLAIVFVSTVLAAVVAFTATPIYRAEILLSPLQ